MIPILASLPLVISGRGTKERAGFELAVQSLHVVFEVVGAFAVLCLLVVAAPTSEIGCCRMDRSRQRAEADAISVDVFVPGESTEAVERSSLLSTLPRLDRSLRVFKRIGHPIVHAQIKVGHDEHQRLKMLRQA